MTQESIIQKHWPKPSEVESVPKMQEAIKKMMDEWAAEQSVLFLEYHRRFRIEEGMAFKRECDRLGGIFSMADIGAKKIYEKFINGEPIKSESMSGVQHEPPLMNAFLNGKKL